MKILLGLLFAVAYITLGLLIKGYVLYVMWAWFLVPLGVPQVNIPQALGISFIAHMLTNDIGAARDENPNLYLIFSPLIVLAFGWIVKQFL